MGIGTHVTTSYRSPGRLDSQQHGENVLRYLVDIERASVLVRVLASPSFYP
jgi:hypothetical protein